MVFSDGLQSLYSVIRTATNLTMSAGEVILQKCSVIGKTPVEPDLPPYLKNLDVSKFINSGGTLIRLAGISGAMAVVLGAYGAHTLPRKDNYEERQSIYHTANLYHFFHALALAGTPLCRYPKTAASFMTLGMLFFCGTCYYQAFTGDAKLKKLTPFGGVCLILGWLSMLL